jgi:hypothetical protein
MTNPNAGIAAWNFKLVAEIHSYEDCARFCDGYERKLGPQMVVYPRLNADGASGYAVKLYDTEIIRYYPDGLFSVDNGGFATPTTRERLQAVLPDGFMAYHHSTKWTKGGLGLYSSKYGIGWAKRRKVQPANVLWPLDHSIRIDPQHRPGGLDGHTYTDAQHSHDRRDMRP